MTKLKNLVYLLLFGAGLLALKYLVIDQVFGSAPKDADVWFTSGLLLVILGVFVTEKYFTRSLDVIVNVITLLVVLLTLGNPSAFRLWTPLLVYTSIVGVIALGSFVLYDEHKDPSHWTQRIANAGGSIARFFGSSRMLFSLMFILSIFNYFVFSFQTGLAITSQQIAVLYLIVFWGAVLLIEPIDRRLIQPLINALTAKSQSLVVAQVERRISPNIIVARQLVDAPALRVGALLSLGSAKKSYAEGAERHALMFLYAEESGDSRFAFFYSLDSDPDQLSDRTLVHRLSATVEASMRTALSDNPVVKNRDNLIGFVHSGSDINVIRIKMIEDIDRSKKLKEGDLVSVDVYGQPVKYQIINAETSNESVEGQSRQGGKIITAQQIGSWEGDHQRFADMGWVPEVNAPVFVEHGGTRIETLAGGYYRVGVVPRSEYPIYIDLAESVSHHIAIIGKTGTGKSRMAANIINQMAASGYRVIVFEVDRKHEQSLSKYIDQSLVESQNSENFDLDKATKPIVSLDLEIKTDGAKGGGTLNMSDSAANLIERVVQYQVKHEDQKICVVMEEAYDFIPENSFGKQDYGQPTVSRISQLVLKCRKHNIGFMIITQRTALVTKTILYQCHTIIALQSFDETSKNFMGAYISQRYLDSMSILPRFRAIVVGKGSSCDKPVIVDFYDGALAQAKAAAPAEPIEEEVAFKEIPALVNDTVE